MTNSKKSKAIIIIICAAVVLAFSAMICLGAFMGYGPFHGVRNIVTSSLEGNADEYSFDKIEKISSPLEGKNICVLGSSVVYGYSSGECAVAEYLGARLGCSFTKEAVSGTTLVDSGPFSYVSRLKKLDKNAHYDLFICQLSTNDATKKMPLGQISGGADFDTSTVTGAMEFIIDYASETWHCPVMFFTGSRYDSPEYAAMVSRLLELKEKYGIGVIDLWSGDEFNALTPEQRALFMSDNVHPTKAGYRDWWGPETEKQIIEYLETK